jgi:arylformamidase
MHQSRRQRGVDAFRTTAARAAGGALRDHPKLPEKESAMTVTEVIDLSHELFDGMPNIGANPVTFGPLYTFAGVREMSGGRFAMQGNLIVMPEHCGTHLDAPAHFVDGGTSTADLDLSGLVLPGHLLDLRHKARGEAISPEDLDAAAAKSGRDIGPGRAMIVWTGADAYWGKEDYATHRPYLPTSTANWLVDRKISLFCTDLVGMDDPAEWWCPTHETWLRAGIPMVQQLCNLDRLEGKDFVFCALPLKMRTGTGSPVRAAALVLDG